MRRKLVYRNTYLDDSLDAWVAEYKRHEHEFAVFALGFSSGTQPATGTAAEKAQLFSGDGVVFSAPRAQ